MTKIGLISDTHGYLDPLVHEYFNDCNEVWHIGDFGPNVADQLKEKYKTRGVYGNIDDVSIRSEFPEYLSFELEGVKFLLIHIGGYPKKFNKRSRELLEKFPSDVHIVGHSHICKAMRDDELGLIHLNPGAAGIHGFHHTRTIMTFEIKAKKLLNLKVIELGPRSSLS